MKTIDLAIHPGNYNFGAYAIVVFDKEKKRAYKIFKQRDDMNHLSNVFNSEVKAYEIAMADKELSNYIPKYFGKISIGKLANAQDAIVNDKAYEMELIEGNFIKISLLSPSPENCKILERFKKKGVEYLKDASVILDEHSRISKIIDFATEEFEVWAND